MCPNQKLKKVNIILLTGTMLFLFSSIASYGQKRKVLNDATYDDRPIHFGFTLGINTFDLSIKNTGLNAREDQSNKLIADVLQIQPGFHVSMVASIRLNDYFKVRVLPGLAFGERKINFTNTRKNDSTLNSTMILSSSMIEVPVIFKYKAKRINNFTPYLLVGSNFRYDIAAKGEFSQEENSQSARDPVYIRLKPFDIALETGVGIDFYLPYFKFTTEIKLSNGMFDILNHEAHPEHPQYVNAIESIKSSMVMISFHFE